MPFPLLRPILDLQASANAEYQKKGEFHMKDFQKFCDSLDQDFIDTIISETTYVVNQNVSFPNALLANSFAISMRLLERYHEWMNSDE